MTAEIAAGLRDLPRIVVNDAFRLAPDADALCANDAKWWDDEGNTDAILFKGRKFSTRSIPGVERVMGFAGIGTDSNSALLGLHVGIHVMGWTRALLYGVDLSGTHYFGPHKRLKNTTPTRFEVFKEQFARYARTLPKGAEVLNASPNSALQCFPFLS